MLADEIDNFKSSGTLNDNVHLPSEWLNSLIDLIFETLPLWRDDPNRKNDETAENTLTSQLCSYLNGLVRRNQGWDFLQFKTEEPDETKASRAIDLVAKPCGTLVWLSGRKYSQYETLLPIECKRLPVPRSSTRDEREYVYSRFSTTGGIQRFKDGNHAAIHKRGAMIGYIQQKDILQWKDQINFWINDLNSTSLAGWEKSDQCFVDDHNVHERVARLHSKHIRILPLEPILLDHLWIEM